VIELHLIGYTEDGEHLVLDLEADGEGRYVLPVDPDLLATLETVREQRLAEGLPVDERAAPAPPPETSTRAGSDRAAGAARPDAPPFDTGAGVPAEAVAGANGRLEERGDQGQDPPEDARPGGDAHPDADAAARGGEAADRPADAEAAAEAPSEPSSVPAISLLSPAEIQAMLRAGRSVRTVAREAGTETAWIERWQAPILAERERVLADARDRRIDQPHARALGGSVERQLADRGVEPETARWEASRRDDGRWRITVRFDEKGRARSATWLLDPAEPHLRPQSPLATELASPRGRPPARRR
jgi:hypothetical protein